MEDILVPSREKQSGGILEESKSKEEEGIKESTAEPQELLDWVTYRQTNLKFPTEQSLLSPPTPGSRSPHGTDAEC